MRSEIDPATRSLDVELDAREAREARAHLETFEAALASECHLLGLRSYCVFDEAGSLITGGEVR